MKKAGLLVGTRPEIIKMSSLIKAYQSSDFEFVLIHSNQHYSAEMDKVFFDNLELPPPQYHLNVGSASHALQTANILAALEPILIKEKINVLYVQGDTNTVLAGALCACKLGIEVAHVEAGLRSFDKGMPEEHNRVIADHVSDYLFAVTSVQESILLQEGISSKKIHVVGNTVVDALLRTTDLIQKVSLNSLHSEIKEQNYFLITAHRPSNVDDKNSLQELVDLCASLGTRYNKKMVWPIHPRAKANMEKFKTVLPEGLILLGPQDYLHFQALMINSFAILTDSGGLQEEACVLKVPCLTLRENTERPESVEAGGNILVGRDIHKAQKAMEILLERNKNWSNPFGDGQTAKRIMAVVHQNDEKIIG